MKKLVLLLLLSPCFAQNQVTVSLVDQSTCAVAPSGNASFCLTNQGQVLVSFSGGPLQQLGGQANGVQSFNGRSGAVSPAGNDYSFSMLMGQVGLGQLPLIPFTSLTGQALLAQLPTIPITQVSGTVPLAQLPMIPFGQVSGAASPSQVPPLSQQTGPITPAQMPTTFTITSGPGSMTCAPTTGTVKSGFTCNFQSLTLNVTGIQ